jgi:hypothetical protein
MGNIVHLSDRQALRQVEAAEPEKGGVTAEIDHQYDQVLELLAELERLKKLAVGFGLGEASSFIGAARLSVLDNLSALMERIKK